EPGFFVGIPCHENCERQIALRADGKSFRRIAYDDVINDAGRVWFEVDDAHRIDIAISGTCTSVVSHECDLTARHDVDAVWGDTSRHVVLLVDYLFAVDLEKRHLVSDRLHDQRLGAIA